MHQPISFFRAFALMWGLLVCPPAALLLASCVTTPGVAFAVAALLLGIAPSLAWMDPERAWLRRLAFACIASWLMIALWLFSSSPDGHPREGARVQNRYTGGTWCYNHRALGSLLPEIDQFMLGFKLVPMLDPLFTMRQSRSLSAMTKFIYVELEADPDFHALGSVMPDAYDDLFGFAFERGHYFLYQPPRLSRRSPLPALVFLHGSGGNFKAYTWVLSRLADEVGMVVIAPSFGMGDWDTKHGVPAVEAALDDASTTVSIDPNQVHLAGLSNGGLGVSRIAVSNAGQRFRSLIFLSPVCDTVALGSQAFADQWKDKPVLIISGKADDRVPLDFVTRCADTMGKAGARVEMTAYDNSDHFLFFSDRDRYITQLTSWLKGHQKPQPPATPN